MILPLLFLFRAFFTFNSSINIGDNKIFNVSLYEGKGKIEKIDNRYPLNNSYLYISNKSNGNYEIIGQIENIENRYSNDYLTIKSERISPIPQNKVKEYFQEKTDSLLKNSPYLFKLTSSLYSCHMCLVITFWLFLLFVHFALKGQFLQFF